MASISYLSQNTAQAIDADLMSEKGGFTLEQLMELAGLSVAQAIFQEYPPDENPRAVICCGPGNNGGDGLVAARHLKHFGYAPTIYYPKPTEKPIYKSLVTQLKNLNISIVGGETSGSELRRNFDDSDFIVDAVFGFSFSGDVRSPFDIVIGEFSRTAKPIVSVDVPSGWHVENGNVGDKFHNPSMLVSLTAPKTGTKGFKAKHWLGGRFIPPALAESHGIVVPSYPGMSQCVKISD